MPSPSGHGLWAIVLAGGEGTRVRTFLQQPGGIAPRCLSSGIALAADAPAWPCRSRE
jgi:hypothetical protein